MPEGVAVQAEGGLTFDSSAAPMAAVTQASTPTRNGDAKQDAARRSAQLLKRRKSSLGPNTATHLYKDGQPLHIVRGEGCHLYNADGEEFLDCVNNVAHVGHCHPQVVQAISEQLATLNTNVRYIHNSIVEFAERLVATLTTPLEEPITAMYRA